MQNVLSSENKTLDHSAIIQSFLSLAQVRQFWHCLLFKSGLTQGKRQLKPMSCISVRGGSWSTDSSCSSLFVNLPHIFEWVLFHNPLQGVVILIACTLFSTSFPSLQLSVNMLGHRALWTASFFNNDLLCLALLVQSVNDRILGNCQVSSLPHDCVAYRTRLRDHLQVFWVN